jgi:hypothetical protein
MEKIPYKVIGIVCKTPCPHVVICLKFVTFER